MCAAVDKPIVNRRRKLKVKRGPSQGIKPFSNKWMLKVYDEKPPFPEELFSSQFSKPKLETLVAALKQATDKEVSESTRLLEEDYTYSLQVTCHKVPHVSVHLTRVTLKHSLLDDDSEIALFVKDLKRGRRLDFEPTIQHFETLLKDKKVNHKITIIPVNQLYNEYATFEARRKLCYLYDKFLVDSRVATHVNGFLGSKMLKKGCLALPVNLTKDNLNDEIDNALRKVFYKHTNRGITLNIKVGKHTLSNDKIAENVIELLRQFGNVHPGGYKNVHKLHLRPQANLSVSIPIYVSMEKPFEGIPVAQNGTEVVAKKEAEEASKEVEEFDINAAAKLIKRRLPSAQLLSDELLLSEEETDEPVIKRLRTTTESIAPIERQEKQQVQKVEVVKDVPVIKPNAVRKQQRNDNAPIVQNKKPNNRQQSQQQQNNARTAAGIALAQKLDTVLSALPATRNDNFNLRNQNNSFNDSFGNNDSDFTRRPFRGGGGGGNNGNNNGNSNFDNGSNYGRNDNFSGRSDNFNSKLTGRGNDNFNRNDNFGRFGTGNSFNGNNSGGNYGSGSGSFGGGRSFNNRF